MTAESIREALRCGRSSCACGKGNTHCPAHDDADPSLSVTDGRKAPLVKCFKGCTSAAIIEALKDRGLWEQAEKPVTLANEPVAQYRYITADGEIVGIKGRFESIENGDRKKTFLWKVPGVERWSGLGDRGIESMPLYNLPDLMRRPDFPVILVEGEKACHAILDRGELAVCLGGGASQQRFGNALDPLRDREVILWPDNDEPGQALMARIHAILPHAKWLRPVLPPKGDAYDYFAQGGTVDALAALMKDGTPSVSIQGPDAVTVTSQTAQGEITFEFTEMLAGVRSLDCALKVTVNAPGMRRTPYTTRLNTESQSARTGAVSELNAVYGIDSRNKDSFKWAPLLSEAKDLAVEAWRGVDRSVSMAHVELIEERSWFLEGLIPEHLVTIPFGQGGGGKSITFGVLLSVCSLAGVPFLGMPVKQVASVLVVDYEDTQQEWRLRFEEVAKGLGVEVDWERVRWLPGNGIPLVDQAEIIRRLHSEHNFGLMIIDSCISAVGGDLLDTTAAQRLVNWLTAFGRDAYVTSVLLAHVPKIETKEQTLYPFGNVFYHNLPRSTVFVESHQEEGARVMEGVLRHRKASRGRHKPVPFRVTFPEIDGDAIRFEGLDYTPDSVMTGDNITVQAIVNALKAGPPLTAGKIAEVTGIKPETVRKTLYRNIKLFNMAGKEGRAELWVLIDARRNEPGF